MKTTKQLSNPILKPTTNLKIPIKQPHLKTSINQTNSPNVKPLDLRHIETLPLPFTLNAPFSKACRSGGIPEYSETVYTTDHSRQT